MQIKVDINTIRGSLRFNKVLFFSKYPESAVGHGFQNIQLSSIISLLAFLHMIPVKRLTLCIHF